VHEFLDRPRAGEWPYLWLDATYLKVRQGGRIISVAAIIAVAVNTDGRREIIGLCVGPSEAETFWTEFLRSLKGRGLDGVKPVISDAHTGLKAAITRIFDATWQRCRVHWMRNALAHVPKGQHTVVAAAIRQAFNQPDQKGAVEVWRHVADQLRPRWPKLATLMDESEADVLAYMAFPAQHRSKLHSTNPLERLNKEVKRRADVVGIFPNEDSIIRLIGAVLFEQNDDWQSQHRYMMVEAFSQIDTAQTDPLLSITTQAA
jgi:transposase-like protein